MDEYPDPRTLDWNKYQGWDANDDFVLSDPNIPNFRYRHYNGGTIIWWWLWHVVLPAIILIMGLLYTFRKQIASCHKRRQNQRIEYQQLK